MKTVPTSPPAVHGSPATDERLEKLRERQGVPDSKRRTAKQTTNNWSRWLHVYTSMISFVIVIFFGLTGITLNHPTWTFGSEVVRSDISGQLPESVLNADGDVEFLMVSEFLREAEGVKGEVNGFDTEGTEGSITYKSPGYSAQVVFDTESGTYDLATEQQGWLAVMNELHKGRDANSPWRWTIDIAGAILVIVGVSGLVIQFVMRKRRTKALISVAVGGLISVALAGWALL
ncbi:MAG: peptidase [Acidimicrobiales bacterium]|nr:peptidase [Acidimicrobiales bacterium]